MVYCETHDQCELMHQYKIQTRWDNEIVWRWTSEINVTTLASDNVLTVFPMGPHLVLSNSQTSEFCWTFWSYSEVDHWLIVVYKMSSPLPLILSDICVNCRLKTCSVGLSDLIFDPSDLISQSFGQSGHLQHIWRKISHGWTWDWCKVTISLTSGHRNWIHSSLSSSWWLGLPWRNSFKVFLRYHIQNNCLCSTIEILYMC